jgi:hypothetical protein
MAINRIASYACINPQFHRGSHILFSSSLPGMGDSYYHSIIFIMNNYFNIPEFQRTINNIAIITHNSDKELKANYKLY